MKVPPLAIRALLCSDADPEITDFQETTPLDRFRMAAVSPLASRDSSDVGVRYREILEEFTERPTVAVGMLDAGGRILSARFANMGHDRITFATDSSIGLYFVTSQRVVYVKTLKQDSPLAKPTIRCLSINPELGTVVVGLDVVDAPVGGGTSLQNKFIIWPSGNFPKEEPLQLNIPVERSPVGPRLPTCAILSKTQGPQMMLGRLFDGKVISFRLAKSRTKLKTESELASGAGLIASSDDGNWIAVVMTENGVKGVKVFSYVSESGTRLDPATIFWCKNRDPSCMAIQEKVLNNNRVAHLALAEPAPEGQPPLPIEILAVGLRGDFWTVYRLRIPSPCLSLSYCLGSATHLLSGHTDGMVALCDLQEGKTHQRRGSPNATFLDISSDRALVCAVESHYLRFFRVWSDKQRPSQGQQSDQQSKESQ